MINKEKHFLDYIMEKALNRFLPSYRGSENLGTYFFHSVMLVVVALAIAAIVAIFLSLAQYYILIIPAVLTLFYIPVSINIYTNLTTGIISKILQLFGVSEEIRFKFEDTLNIGMHAQRLFNVKKGGSSSDTYAIMYSYDDSTGLTEDEVRAFGYKNYGLIANRTQYRGPVFDEEYATVLAEIRSLNPSEIVILVSKSDANVSSSYLKGRLEIDTSIPVSVRLV